MGQRCALFYLRITISSNFACGGCWSHIEFQQFLYHFLFVFLIHASARELRLIRASGSELRLIHASARELRWMHASVRELRRFIRASAIEFRLIHAFDRKLPIFFYPFICS